MPFKLNLPEVWEKCGWKAKIHDCERLEPPHVTIMFKTRAWRFDLRTESFLDKVPHHREVPEDVLAAIRANLAILRQSWDQMFPDNPVSSLKHVKKKKGASPHE